jgi:large subunit ribosomal protein L5
MAEAKTTAKDFYAKTVLPVLMSEFGYTNKLAAPRIQKVIVHVGTGNRDAKLVEVAEETLRRITGQQPVRTKAKKSISNFKLREGQIIGVKTTLRGPRMYDFLNKLVNVTFPRVRDFRGLPESIVDKTGNASVGFKEHIAFPEISSDEVERIHGLEVVIDTTAKNRAEGLALLKALGFPFQTK